MAALLMVVGSRAPWLAALLLAVSPASSRAAGPEPAGWYAGDMHVHRSCGGAPASVPSMVDLMSVNDLAFMSLLADMGNGEVQDPTVDLPRVDGLDDPLSSPGRIAHWDAEWHWDPIYEQFPHHVLGGHLVALGVPEAHQTFDEYTYPVLQWARASGGIAGFAHMQYLDEGLPQTLSCCGPLEYPVEVALGAADFISEDVVDAGRSIGGMDPEAAIAAYYRLLNTGFRPGLAAGTDYPCNSGPPGSLLTYGQTAGGQQTYRAWLDAIAGGRTVVSRNGHAEFLKLVAGGGASPGDQLDLASAGFVDVAVEWAAGQSLSGTIELVQNGTVVASRQASAAPGAPATLTATVRFERSGWLAARRMGTSGHQVHTAAVFVIVGGAPVRASAPDANFYVQWMDTLLQKTSPGGEWNHLFPTSLAAAQARYLAARAVFQQIAAEAAAQEPPPSGTIWSSAATPAIVDTGPDRAVELGVKFRSDVNGFVTGIRFYKAAANTGPHVGNLWSSAGTRLATATFTNESTSGWQEVSFATPVPISAGVVYVASYHAPTGHYSDDVFGFASAGVDSPPLHALADGASGPNGVYAYGSTSIFPSQGWNSSNYWVDVVFRPATDLVSIAVTPAAPTVPSGGSVQFSATATHADGTTQDVSAAVAWSSSSAAVATVDASGRASALAGGTAIISATLEGISGSTTLTVQAAPLAVATSRLPAALRSTTYSTPVVASGGTPPYAWSMGAGAPPGLSMDGATGVIAGTPTTSGYFWFAVTVQDANGASASRSLSIQVESGGSDCTLWPASAVPSLIDGGPDAPVELGVKFRSEVSGFAKGIRFYKSAANTGPHVANLWSSSGTLLASAPFTGETESGWQVALFPAPVHIDAETTYVASYHTSGGHYSADPGYFSAVMFAPPLRALAGGASGGNGVYAYGAASSFPDQSWMSTNYWVDVIFTVSPGKVLGSLDVYPSNPIATVLVGRTQEFRAIGYYSDGSTRDYTSEATWTSSAPAVATVNAAGIATGLSAGTTTISAAFRNLTGGSTLLVQDSPLAMTTTALPSGASGAPYSAVLEASGGSRPYTWTSSAGLPPGLTLDRTTGTISGTPTSVGAYEFSVTVHDASFVGAASRLLGITIFESSEHTLWPPTAAPAIPDAGPDAPVELGVRFRADVQGVVSGIRFYKGPGNTGTHVGSLWSSSGVRLAAATFTDETASGWQQVNFATPVSIAANTVYVASYHTDVGHYAIDSGYFTAALDAPPLHFPADGSDGPNGVFAYGGPGTFPSTGWLASNYWVDVVFRPTAPVATLATIAVAPATPVVQGLGSQQFTATGVYSDGSVLDVTSSVAWASSNPAVATVSSAGIATAAGYGATTISASRAGVTGTAVLTWSVPPPPPDEGPGGPILVISSAANPFSRYNAELLRAEGLNAFTATDIANVTSASLAGREVVILGEFPLAPSQAALLSAWVEAGGNLIAMRPDPLLAPLLGLTPAGGTLSEGYVRVATGAAPGQGIAGETLQFHGAADLYVPAGATVVAALYATSTLDAGAPAVTVRDVGAGKAAAFTYDLARSVVYTRQGNPAWSGQERDGVPPIRSDDLFFGNAAFDPRPDWLDFSRVEIPQADEQQRLLANLIVHMNQARAPLPRFWYLPSGLRAAVVMTGDDHAGGGTVERFEAHLAASSAGCSVEDWECVRSTSYVYPASPITDAEAQLYASLGFEVALHVSTGCVDYAGDGDLDAFFAGQLAEFGASYPSVAAPSTNRTHCIAWSDYDTQPKVELAHGIRLDANYYYWPGAWTADRPGLMGGSGFPMRFADRAGRAIDVYQAMTQLTDESDQSYPLHVDTLLDNALGPKGYYGVFTANMHTDVGQAPAADAVVASAQARGVPVISARQLLAWLDGRDASSFRTLSWDGSVLAFDVTAGAGARNLQAMLPVQAAGRTLTALTRAGAGVPFTTATIKGVAYAFFPATTATYRATYQ